MKLLKKYIFPLFIIFYFNSNSLADDFNFKDIVGSSGLSHFELEMRETFLLQFCRNDKETDGQDIFQCLMNSGRPLKPDQKEIMLAIPGNNLRNGFFSKFEKSALAEIDFEKELSKTPTGQQLIQLYSKNKNDIRIKIFYHLERSENLFSNMLTLERLEPQAHTHFGFTVSENNKATIGLNAFQKKDEIFYTLLHELYHLFDPNFKKNPTPIDLFLQEARALAFELRVYIERQKMVPKDNYSFSKFHEEFLIRTAGQDIAIDWSKLGYYSRVRFFTQPDKNKFLFNSAKDTDFLNIDSSGRMNIKTVMGGIPFDEVLLDLFKDELQKPQNEQDQSTIVARLLYSLPKNIDMKQIEYNYDVAQRIIKAVATSLSQDYGYLLDFSQHVPLRMNGINELSTGGPRPRNEGGP